MNYRQMIAGKTAKPNKYNYYSYMTMIVIQLSPWAYDDDGLIEARFFGDGDLKEVYDPHHAYSFNNSAEAAAKMLKLKYPVSYDDDGNAYPRVVRITSAVHTDEVLFRHENKEAV